MLKRFHDQNRTVYSPPIPLHLKLPFKSSISKNMTASPSWGMSKHPCACHTWDQQTTIWAFSEVTENVRVTYMHYNLKTFYQLYFLLLIQYVSRPYIHSYHDNRLLYHDIPILCRYLVNANLLLKHTIINIHASKSTHLGRHQPPAKRVASCGCLFLAQWI